MDTPDPERGNKELTHETKENEGDGTKLQENGIQRNEITSTKQERDLQHEETSDKYEDTR